jgi:hypothetical protein
VGRSANGDTGSIAHRWVLLSAFVVCTTSLATVAHATPDDTPASPPSSRAPGPLARMFPLTETADWLSAAYYATSQSYYDISFEAVDLGRAWRLGSMLELQGRLGAFHSQGERLDAPYLPSQDSTTTGVTFGGGARLYVLQLRQARLFIEGSVEILYTPGGQQFPVGGTGVNAFLRTGGGLQYQLTRRLALEAHLEYAHLSNGAGSVEQNPMWNGHGGGLTLRCSI